jgi:hypothetical protein
MLVGASLWPVAVKLGSYLLEVGNIRYLPQPFRVLESVRIRFGRSCLSMQESNLGTLLVIILLTQNLVSIVTSQLKPIKATPSGRYATLTRLTRRARIFEAERLFKAVKVRAATAKRLP